MPSTFPRFLHVSKTDEAIQRLHRGDRVLQVREALQLSGEEFAALLMHHLRAYGVAGYYDKPKVSRIERGVREVSALEALVIAEMDPKGRSIKWLLVGSEAHPASTRLYQAVDAGKATSRRRKGGR